MADFNRYFPSSHGTQDAQGSLKLFWNTMNLFGLEAQNAF